MYVITYSSSIGNIKYLTYICACPHSLSFIKQQLHLESQLHSNLPKPASSQEQVIGIESLDWTPIPRICLSISRHPQQMFETTRIPARWCVPITELSQKCSPTITQRLDGLTPHHCSAKSPSGVQLLPAAPEAVPLLAPLKPSARGRPGVGATKHRPRPVATNAAAATRAMVAVAG